MRDHAITVILYHSVDNYYYPLYENDGEWMRDNGTYILFLYVKNTANHCKE